MSREFSRLICDFNVVVGTSNLGTIRRNVLIGFMTLLMIVIDDVSDFRLGVCLSVYRLFVLLSLSHVVI